MYNVTLDNREEIENEFMALVLNKPEVIDLLQIKPKILKSKKNQVLLRYAIECYKKIGYIDLGQIAELHNDVNVDYFVDIYLNTMWYEEAWKEQLKIAQESILKFYKEDVIKACGEKLKNKKITYDEYMSYIKKLDDIQLLDDSSELTKKEILESINEKKAKINLNKFEKLNNVLKLVQGDFLIIGATTGAGKSGFLINLLADLMNSYQCIYFNMEMSKSTIYKRIVSVNANLKIEDVENPRSEHQKKAIDKALDKIEACKIIVEHKATDIQSLKNVVARLKDSSRHTIIFVDHIGLVKCDSTKSLYEQATEVAKQLRQLCLDYDCTIISASQLNRGAYGTEEVTLSMLKDSGELENSASKVMLLYKNKNAKKEDLVMDMIINVAKNRDGYTGTIDFIYDKEKQIFIEK